MFFLLCFAILSSEVGGRIHRRPRSVPQIRKESFFHIRVGGRRMSHSTMQRHTILPILKPNLSIPKVQNFSDCNVKMIIPVFRGVYMTLMTHRRSDCHSESACCLPSPVPMSSSREKPESMLGSGNAVFSISAFPLQLPPFPACFSLLQNSRALVFSPSYLTTAIEKLRILRPNYQLI